MQIGGFQDTGSTVEEKKSDFAAGPAFRVHWNFVGPMYFNMEATYGLRELSRHLTFNFQDMVSFSFGVQF